MMRAGDKVRIKPYGIAATVSLVDGDSLYVTDGDGFEYVVEASQVESIGPVDPSEILAFRNSVSLASDGKEIRKQTGSGNARELVIDLHVEALVQDRSGLTDADKHRLQIDAFRQTLDRELAHHGRRIVFIHGKGDGILRRELIAVLNKRPGMTWQDAPVEKYGFQGAVRVTVK